MQFIQPPHLILRKALIQRMKITSFAVDIGKYMAATLYGSSALSMDGGSLRSAVAHWSHNIAMCALTEKVIFTDPYTVCDINRWTAPQLDAYAAGIRADTELKLAASHHKSLFVTSTQALVHGDLHTGSVMVTEGSTFVIDPEFAFYGPMGFDVGLLLANMFLAYFSQAGRDGADSDDDYAEWILQQTQIAHETFQSNFVSQWSEESSKHDFAGQIYHSNVYTSGVHAAQSSFMTQLWWDSVGFAGVEMIRRIVGIAHVEDLEGIADADRRARCEKTALIFARRLALASFHRTASLGSLAEVLSLARASYKSDPPAEWPTA